MSGELQRYASGGERPARMERAVAQQAKAVYDEVRLQGFKADGVTALAGHIMEKMVELDRLRQDFSGQSQFLNQILVEIEVEAIHGAKKLQRDLFNDWNL